MTRDPEEQWENPDPRNAQTAGHLVRPVSTRELAIYGQSGRYKACANCRFFNQRAAQEMLFKDKQLATIIHDYEWTEKHLCTPADQLGVCEQRGCFTGPTYPPCEDYRAK